MEIGKEKRSSTHEKVPLLGMKNKTNSYARRILNLVKNEFPILPSDPKKQVWDLVVLFCIVYNCFSIPIQLSFRNLWTSTDARTIFAINFFADFIFILDIIVHFYTIYLDKGMPRTNLQEIRRHYLRSWFIIDLISVIPIDLFVWTVWIHALLRINRLLKLSRTPGYFHNWETHARYSHFVSLLKLFIYLVVFDVWLACMYISLAYREGFGSTPYVPPKEYEEKGFWDLFEYAFFFSTRILTDVGGEIPEITTNLERGFHLTVCLVVLFTAAAIIAALVELVRSIREESEEFLHKVGSINRFMDRKSVNEDLQHRIVKYFNYLWNRSEGIEEEEILEELPSHLRTAVNFHSNGELVRRVPFFSNAPQGFINSLVNYLRPEIFAPGECVVKIGEVSTDMFFLESGSVEVLNKEEKRITILHEGEYFGEIGVLMESPRTASIRALEFSNIYVLSKRDLDRVLKSFPNEETNIKKLAESRLLSDRLRELLPKLFIFSKCSSELINKLIARFEHELFSEGDVIFDIDDESDGLYFIANGIVSLYDESKRIIKTLAPVSGMHEGCFFGHIDPILDRTRRVSAKVAKRGILLFISNILGLVGWISTDSLHELESEFPEEWKIILKLAENHRDRHSQVFSSQETLKRPPQLLWARAMTKIIMLSRWGHFKANQNREFLHKINNLRHKMEDISQKDAIKAFSILSECKDKLTHMIHELPEPNMKLMNVPVRAVKLSKDFVGTPAKSPLVLSPFRSPAIVRNQNTKEGKQEA